MKQNMRIKTLLIGLAGLVFSSQPSFAQTTAPDSLKKEWTFSIAPYFWLAGIGANIKHEGAGGTAEAEVEVGVGDYVDKLAMALPLALEARFGRWAIASDLLYMKLNDENSRVKAVEFNSGTRLQVNASADAGTHTTLKVTGWTLLSGYRLYETDKGSFEPTLGLRYFGVKATTDWNLTGAVTGPGINENFQQSGSVEESDGLWDFLIGFRGVVRLDHHKLSVPYYLDLGTGQSDFTWQAMTGLSYAFNWGDVTATYRHLEYDASGSNLVRDLSFSGPSFGVSFSF